MYVYDDYPLVIKRGNGKPTTCIWLSYKPPCSSQILQLAMFEDFISNTTQLAVDILWLRNPAPIDRWAKSPYTYNLQSHYRLSHSLQCFIGIPVSSPCLVRRFRGKAPRFCHFRCVKKQDPRNAAFRGDDFQTKKTGPGPPRASIKPLKINWHGYRSIPGGLHGI